MSAAAGAGHARLFGFDFRTETYAQALETLCRQVGQRPARVVVPLNVDCVILADESSETQSLYAGADFIYADGMPIIWSSRLLKARLPERVTGADLFVSLCQRAQQNRWHVAVIGGMPGQEPMLLDRFAAVYPGLKASVHCPPMGFRYQGPEGLAAGAWVNTVKPDIVFVCLGFPRQERWSLAQRDQLDASVVLCCGAAMEFALGLRSRAPVFMQRIGLEWFWRLATEPAKLWRRYLVRGPRFLGVLWREWRKQG